MHRNIIAVIMLNTFLCRTQKVMHIIPPPPPPPPPPPRWPKWHSRNRPPRRSRARQQSRPRAASGPSPEDDATARRPDNRSAGSTRMASLSPRPRRSRRQAAEPGRRRRQADRGAPESQPLGSSANVATVPVLDLASQGRPNAPARPCETAGQDARETRAECASGLDQGRSTWQNPQFRRHSATCLR